MSREYADKFNKYVGAMRSACARHCAPGGIYDGIEGCKRLAREVGCAIPDFTEDSKEIHDLISGTYSGICVILYNLKPPVDAGVWIKAMYEGVEKSLDLINTIRTKQKAIDDFNKEYQNDKRYMRYEVNPYRGNRYAIYDRNKCTPDSIVFCTHDKEKAIQEWERIKDFPSKKNKNGFIEW